MMRCSHTRVATAVLLEPCLRLRVEGCGLICGGSVFRVRVSEGGGRVEFLRVWGFVLRV